MLIAQLYSLKLRSIAIDLSSLLNNILKENESNNCKLLANVSGKRKREEL